MTKIIASRRRRNTSKRSVASKSRKVKIPLKPADIPKLLKNAKEGRQKRIITIMLETGMHPSVMANPEKYEMEIVRGQLAWHRTKTYALCVWEFDGSMKPLIDEFIANDLGYDRSTYWKDVKKASNKANLRHVSPLTLRHTATIELLKKHSPETVKQITQVSDRTLWNCYAKVRHLDRLGEERAKERG